MGLAADRGVTICFADLDGADGLWVPEERTILVSRRLSEQRVNEVVEHELEHVAIDDQHAALDAGVWAKPGRSGPAWLSQRWAAPALSVAAFVALVGGVTAGLSAARPDGADRGTVTPTLQPTSVPTPGAPEPTTAVVTYTGTDGVVRYRTITMTPTASPSLPTGSAPASPTGPTGAAPSRKPGTTTPGVPPLSTTPAPVTPSPTVSPTPDPTTPDTSTTSPAAASASVGGEPTG